MGQRDPLVVSNFKGYQTSPLYLPELKHVLMLSPQKAMTKLEKTVKATIPELWKLTKNTGQMNKWLLLKS